MPDTVHFVFETKALLQLIFDIVLIAWFLRPAAEQIADRRRLFLGAFVLLFTAPLYFLTDIHYLIRVVLRIAVYFAALSLSGVRSLLRCLYLSVLVTVLFTASQNIFFSPKLFAIYRGTFPFTGVRTADLIICLAIQWAVYILAFWFTRRMIKLDKLDNFEPMEWLAAALALVLEFYIKQALPAVNNTEGEHTEITVFSVILNIIIVAFLGSFVRYLHEKRRAEEMRLQEVMNQAYFRNLELKKQRDEDVRRLHHDMKNHLLAIEKLASGQDGHVGEYIGELTAELEPYESLVETGNELLNGILSEKQALARSKDIDLEIQADCSGLSFISDTDLCTIFGNALDNAIEACEKVQPKEERVIRVKSETMANQVYITVTNSCEGTVDVSKGLPQTTKKDKNMHGIGIRSIRRALEKYNGVLKLRPGERKFTFTAIIPCPDR